MPYPVTSPIRGCSVWRIVFCVIRFGRRRGELECAEMEGEELTTLQWAEESYKAEYTTCLSFPVSLCPLFLSVCLSVSVRLRQPPFVLPFVSCLVPFFCLFRLLPLFHQLVCLTAQQHQQSQPTIRTQQQQQKERKKGVEQQKE